MSNGSRLFNRFRVYFDQNLTAANAIDLANKIHPNRTLFYSDEPLLYDSLPKYKVTVNELFGFVNKLGNLLLSIGMKRYDRVGIYKSNAIDYFFIAQAIIKAGGIAVPINSGMSIEKAKTYLEYTGVKILFTDKQQYSKHIKNTSGFSNITHWLFPDLPKGFLLNGIDINNEIHNNSAELSPCVVHNDSHVMIVHTSGTTGFPKGVIVTSGSLVTGIKKHYLGEPISTKNRIGIAGHFNHLVCYLGLFSSMLGNFKVWGLCNFNAETLFDNIEKHKLNIFFAFPDVYLNMYTFDIHDRKLNAMRVWIATADASHEVHMKHFCQKGAFLRIFGKKILGSLFIEPFGTSEVGFAALTRIFLPFSKIKLKRCIGWKSIGGPKIKVADEYGNKLRANKIGRLMIKGKTMFKGYWNAHDKLHNVLIDGWWWTGDIVYKDWLGRYYHLDRFTDVVTTPKGKVFSLLIEEQLLTHKNISEAAVIGLPHPEKDQVPVGIIFPKDKQNLNPEECLNWLKNHFNNPVNLEKIILSEALPPRGVTGKIIKRKLRKMYAGTFFERPNQKKTIN